MGIRLRRYSGLDLPVFDKERPIAVTRSDLEAVSNDPAAENFIRRIRIIDSSGTPVNRLLEWADTEFDAITKFCGGSVVSHTWGLYKMDPKFINFEPAWMRSRNLPWGYVLAAEVAIVDGGYPQHPAAARAVLEGSWAYRESRAGQPCLFDVSAIQYLEGFERGQSEEIATARPIYVDLDITRSNP